MEGPGRKRNAPLEAGRQSATRMGALLASVIARSNANIVETFNNRAHYGVGLSETAIDVTMETRGREHVAELQAELKKAGYEFSLVE